MEKKKVTIAEIARISGTSAATVSRALNHPELVNEKTLLQIQSAIKRLNYISKSFSREIVPEQLVLVNVSEPSNMFYSDIMEGINYSVRFHNYHAVFFHESLSKDANIHYVLTQIQKYGAAGLILCAPTNPEYCKLLSGYIPLVQCAEYSSEDYSYVGIDNYKSANMALDHIYSLGCRKTLFVNGPLEYRYAQERQEAFITFMKKADIPSTQYQIINLPKIDFDMAFASISQTLYSPNPPDSIFATSDIFAVAASNAAANYKLKIPQDLVIVGFDNINLLSAIATPSITSVNQPRFQMGYTASEILFDAISTKNTESAPKHVILNTELIIRESSNVNTLPESRPWSGKG